jgi:hypothetical protein
MELLVTADDYGYSEERSRGILTAFREGIGELCPCHSRVRVTHPF